MQKSEARCHGVQGYRNIVRNPARDRIQYPTSLGTPNRTVGCHSERIEESRLMLPRLSAERLVRIT